MFVISGMKEPDCIARVLPNVTASLGLSAGSNIYDLGFDVFQKNFTECDMKLVLPSEEYWT